MGIRISNSCFYPKICLNLKKIIAAAVLTLPSRELAVVALHEFPETKKSGAYKVDLSLYLDRKNKPAEKTSLLINGDILLDPNGMALSGESKFIYPSQKKVHNSYINKTLTKFDKLTSRIFIFFQDMIVKGNLKTGGDNILDADLDFDIFDKKEDKITASARVKREDVPRGYNLTSAFDINSKGQNLKVDLKNHFSVGANNVGFGSFLSYLNKDAKPRSVGFFLTATPQDMVLFAHGPEKQLIDYHSNIAISSGLQKFDSELSLLGHKPVIAKIEFKDLNSFDYVFHPKGKNHAYIFQSFR